MLTNEQINENRERFISLLKTINREGADVDGLIKKLDNSDFFFAPASTVYHCSYDGGLCLHSLHVYDQLKRLIGIEYPEDSTLIPEESIVITALLHDMSKMNFYETSERNVKDENGNWTKVPFIKTKEAKDRFIYAGHGVNSAFMVENFLPLTVEESSAIINHMGWSDNQFQGGVISDVFNRYPLATLLHTADLLSTFIQESI